MMGFFRQLLDKTNPISTMRYVLIFGVLFTIPTVIGTWAIITIFKKEIQDIPWGLGTFIIGVLSILITGKVVEKIWGEKPTAQSIITQIEGIKDETKTNP